MPGSQSGVATNIGGGTAKFAPDGTALSPAITGFTGMGLDGVGWGTGVSLDRVWIGGLNGTILVMDLDGKPFGKENDFPMAGSSAASWGAAFAVNGDVWMADGTRNHLLYFPGGRLAGRTYRGGAGLKSPFGVAIDTQNRVWVSNSQGNTVVRFLPMIRRRSRTFTGRQQRPRCSARFYGQPVGREQHVAGISAARDPGRRVDHGAVRDRIETHADGAGEEPDACRYRRAQHDHARWHPVRPEGIRWRQVASSAPWGVSIDGDDDVWFGNFWGRGVGLMAGADPKAHAGKKTGDVIHMFQSDAIQMVTDVGIDPAGDVWVANNWNVSKPVVAKVRPIRSRPRAAGRESRSSTVSPRL